MDACAVFPTPGLFRGLLCSCFDALRYVEFNPVAENVVMTTNADHSVQLCDVAAATDTAALTIDVHTSSINR